MNLSERIRQAMARAESSLAGLSDESLQEQLGELGSIEHDIHALMDDWPEPPDGIKQEIGKLDQRFIVAGELFLDVCEQMGGALEARQPALLVRAKAALGRAYSEMARAEEVARTQMQQWVERGKIPTRADVEAL